ncbi:MAG: DUF2723 domain-containing protein, partial [Candidatus Spechtbacterales bacterium]|nr:DUF2723 domain-containing protein [Candidatus Spechtbacterales bacterium]
MRFLKENVAPVALFFLVFSIYLYTAPRGIISYADSSELITASYTLGIPHPPGYPLFVLIGKLFSFIPVGTIAFRYAIMSSMFGAATVTLVYLALFKVFNRQKETRDKRQETRGKRQEARDKVIYAVIPALVGALSLAFSYLFWLYSIVPEVFALSNFFGALIIFLGVQWHYSKSENRKQKTENSGQEITADGGTPQNAVAENSKKGTLIENFRRSPDYYPVLIA